MKVAAAHRAAVTGAGTFLLGVYADSRGKLLSKRWLTIRARA